MAAFYSDWKYWKVPTKTAVADRLLRLYFANIG